MPSTESKLKKFKVESSENEDGIRRHLVLATSPDDAKVVCERDYGYIPDKVKEI